MRKYESLPPNSTSHWSMGKQGDHDLWKDHSTGDDHDHDYDDHDDNDDGFHDIRAPEFWLPCGVYIMIQHFGTILGGFFLFFFRPFLPRIGDNDNLRR